MVAKFNRTNLLSGAHGLKKSGYNRGFADNKLITYFY
jgi:hypothetical protein